MLRKGNRTKIDYSPLKLLKDIFLRYYVLFLRHNPLSLPIYCGGVISLGVNAKPPSNVRGISEKACHGLTCSRRKNYTSYSRKLRKSRQG
jgi:hypothetical protein